MSFSFNGPEFRPMIQESQSMKNNGGGGNTGYYQRGKKKKEKEKQINVFPEIDEADTFLSEQNETIPEEKSEKLINKLIEKTKNFVKTRHNAPAPGKNNPFKQMDENAE